MCVWVSCRLRLLFRALLFVIGVGLGFCAPAFAQSDPSVVGQWSAVQNLPYEAIHVSLLPNGKVLLWANYGLSKNATLWDPLTNTSSPAATVTYDLFCSGHTLLTDGRLLVTGGHIADDVGYAHAILYDSVANSWTWLPDMNAGRWYPTNTPLPNGGVLVLSGNIDTTTGVNRLPQVWQVSSNNWRDLTTAQLSLPYYPRMFVAPNGKVFYAGSGQTSRYLDTSGTGTWTTVANSLFGSRDYGTAVMYTQGKVFIAGGGDPPTATAEIIDLNAATPAWKYTGSMATARRQLNATILPDGKVLVTGGSSGSGFDNSSTPVYTAELWDPATGKWTTLASITMYRGYHSTALLLPDARVLSAGGDVSGATAEIFSPPYLFKGARPAITTAPASISYGQTFFVETPDAASITQVTLLRLGAATHAFNHNQRINFLGFSQASGGLNVNAPASANLAPPGHYMLFILNGNGVPSVAPILNLAPALPDTTPPGVPSGLSAAAVSGTQINLSWTGSTDNVGVTGYLVERCQNAGCTNFIQIGTSTGTSYNDTGLSNATTYTYRVRATDTAGNLSGYSNTASATTPDTTAPTAPSSLSATAVSRNQINLSWNASTDNVKVTGYFIERCQGNGCNNFAQVGISTGTTYSDTAGVSAGTFYRYRVRATDAASNLSSYSNIAKAKTPR